LYAERVVRPVSVTFVDYCVRSNGSRLRQIGWEKSISILQARVDK
jgi:hypothetical protein